MSVAEEEEVKEEEETEQREPSKMREVVVSTKVNGVLHDKLLDACTESGLSQSAFVRQAIRNEVEGARTPKGDVVPKSQYLSLFEELKSDKEELTRTLRELNQELETSTSLLDDLEIKDSEVAKLRAENDRLLACYFCKPALDYLLSVLNVCEIENFSTTFQIELYNALKEKYDKKHYLETLCDKLSKAYGRTISPENFSSAAGKFLDFEKLTGVKIS